MIFCIDFYLLHDTVIFDACQEPYSFFLNLDTWPSVIFDEVGKLIPKCITSLERNKKIPVHGDGSYVRDWIYVRDNAGAILHLLKSGVKNESYNIGCQNQIKNIDIVNTVIDWFGKGDSSINFVENRWGQDLRYSISNKKLIDTGWQPKYPVGIYKWF